MQTRYNFEVFMYNKLETILANINFKYKTDFRLSNPYSDRGDTINFDATIFFNNKFFSHVEFDFQIDKKKLKEYRNRELRHPILFFSQTEFLIMENEENLTPVSIDRFESELLKIIKDKTEGFMSEINSLVLGMLNEGIHTKLKLDNNFYIAQIFFDYDDLTFRFSEKNLNEFFNLLLPDHNGHICRYTSQESIYQTISNEKQRMFGIAGMNDTEEINYVDNYLYEGRFKPPSSSKHNQRFILSFSSMKIFDNLTMYRLYANDAKGVCLKYKINKNIKDAKFYIKKVKYADHEGINKPLELLKKIVVDIEKTTGHIFDFFGDSGWKYFFKPKEFAIENEVRLLYDSFGLEKKELESKWVITNGNGIINPYVDFSIKLTDNPPIILEQIIIGPKHPEKSLNKKQYEDFVESHLSTIGKITIEQSEIKNYR